MTLEEFFKLGCEMRTAQKEYFRIRTSSSLKRAKALERRFDDAIDELRRPKNQTSLELDFEDFNTQPTPWQDIPHKPLNL